MDGQIDQEQQLPMRKPTKKKEFLSSYTYEEIKNKSDQSQKFQGDSKPLCWHDFSQMLWSFLLCQ